MPCAGLAHLDQRHTAGQLAREVHDDGIAVGQAAVDRGGHRGRRVHDDEVAGAEELAEGVEAGVHGRGVTGADEQPDVVAASGADLGRLVGFVLGVEHEARDGAPGGVVVGLDHGCLDPAATKALAS